MTTERWIECAGDCGRKINVTDRPETSGTCYCHDCVLEIARRVSGSDEIHWLLLNWSENNE